MRKQCVPGSLSSSSAREPGKEAREGVLTEEEFVQEKQQGS